MKFVCINVQILPLLSFKDEINSKNLKVFGPLEIESLKLLSFATNMHFISVQNYSCSNHKRYRIAYQTQQVYKNLIPCIMFDLTGSLHKPYKMELILIFFFKSSYVSSNLRECIQKILKIFGISLYFTVIY